MARSFVAACKNFFGLKEGQSLTEFGQELKALSHEDKMEIAQGLRAVGEDCDDPQALPK